MFYHNIATVSVLVRLPSQGHKNARSQLNSSCYDTACKYNLNWLGLGLGLGTHLFVMVPRLGDSEVTFSVFESSCHLLLPV